MCVSALGLRTRHSERHDAVRYVLRADIQHEPDIAYSLSFPTLLGVR
jgi:hypothetical protein